MWINMLNSFVFELCCVFLTWFKSIFTIFLKTNHHPLKKMQCTIEITFNLNKVFCPGEILKKIMLDDFLIRKNIWGTSLPRDLVYLFSPTEITAYEIGCSVNSRTMLYKNKTTLFNCIYLVTIIQEWRFTTLRCI